MPYEMKITVSKDELLRVMRENRGKHRTVFLAALDGYSQERRRLLEGELRRMEADRRPRELRLLLSVPEDHTSDYDRVIGMLEMDTGETFTLDEQTYAQYVADDWAWKRAWAKMSSHYAGEVYAASYGEIDDE
jgi:hypothetical protein